MTKINSKRLNNYTDRLYNGILRRYKEQQEWEDFYKRELRLDRQKPTRSQINEVIDRWNSECVICKDPYDEQYFEFHHINGNSSHTVVNNLLLVCSKCYGKIHAKARSKLADHNVRIARKIDREPPKKGGKKPSSKNKPEHKIYVPGTNISIDNPL